ncbi:helix-turn-helix domain-containing protein [Pseudosulfitobacter koreensis]|uniref:Helix-turn-helix domain-containing protein n=1 Tax=Pseudosulfitobacter koreensis TaxID=2968472 RepID=A0ABT1Z4K7_9RHOB|nr:helix-turn-helix domain-containing protein [Pseudosulfitobacter koreense]MCR8828050.1 helix-turn-helix domain-containing protein [Pseudosulfitobacter koreense]
MQQRPQPIAVKDTTAAAMLDMPASEFRRLVDRGALPPPKEIGGTTRWRVADLEAIMMGLAGKPGDNDDFE